MGSASSAKKLLLFFAPVYIIVFCSIFIAKSSPFYMTEPDPSYIHLFNGMNLASGNMEIGNTDNPGTTIQCFAAAVIFIKHILSGSAPLYQDVILHPESYLFTCSVLLLILFACINYITGVYIFRRTGSIGLSMLFQLIPFININIIKWVVVLSPEAMIIIMANFFLAYLFIHAPENKMQGEKQPASKTIILFGLFSAFLIVSKYTCSPIVLLVLFMLKSNKQRLQYIGVVILSFFIFIIPALSKMQNMYQWVHDLATHDGLHGKGDNRIIDPMQFSHNLKGLLTTDAVFTSIYSIITLAFIITIINWLRKKETLPYFRTIIGIWISITLLLLAVAKHTEFHYLIFAECCFPLALIVSYTILSASFSPLIQRYSKHEKAILYSFFSLFVLFLIIEKIRYIPNKHPKYVGMDKYIGKYKDVPLVISVKSGLACERNEPAFYLGYMYAGNTQDTYAAFLDKIYPNTFIYWSNTNRLCHWNKTLAMGDFIAKKDSLLIYTKGYEDTAQTTLINQFSLHSTRQLIHSDAETQQSVYLLTK